MNVRSGDDDLFVNQVANSKNTAICFSKNSFTESLSETSFKNWFNQKKRHISSSKYYKPKHKFILALFYVSQFLFWCLSIILFAFLWHWQIVLALFATRTITQYASFGPSAKKLNEQDTLALLPFLELFLIVSQLIIFISNLSSKNSHWK